MCSEEAVMQKIDVSRKRGISGGMHTYPYVSAYFGDHGGTVWEAYYRNNGNCYHEGWMYFSWTAFGTYWYAGDLPCWRH